METTFDRVVKILYETLAVNKSDIKAESIIIQDLADSLDVLDICMEIDESFNLSINEEEIENCSTVSDIVNLVDSKLGQH